MDIQDLLGRVDHTLLAATATWAEIQTLCEEAVQYKTASVCVPPSYVARVAENYHAQGLAVCTVIGFPLGYNTTAAKVEEARLALADGADELDMVVNLGDVKNGDFEKVTAEIAALKKVAGDHILKVIVETCYLTEEEKIRLCGCVSEGGADFIKTSTGFGTGGAQLADIELFKRHLAPGIKIKASGGIRTKEDFETFYNAGCQRIGASAAIRVFGEGGGAQAPGSY